jgi:hypothetical protein
LVWLALGLTVMRAHLDSPRPGHTLTLCALLALVWAQFGFAGVFHNLTRRHGTDCLPLLLVTITPPLLLFLLTAGIALWMGKTRYLAW